MVAEDVGYVHAQPSPPLDERPEAVSGPLVLRGAGALTTVVVLSLGMLIVDANHVRLAVADWAGTGPSASLLHGLAGHAGEWTDTATSVKADQQLAVASRSGSRGGRHCTWRSQGKTATSSR